jgi:hypothetical protein
MVVIDYRKSRVSVKPICYFVGGAVKGVWRKRQAAIAVAGKHSIASAEFAIYPLETGRYFLAKRGAFGGGLKAAHCSLRHAPL